MIGPYHGQNLSGTCSAVAAQLLLGYHNYYSDRRIIDNKYLFTLEDGPNTCTNPMKISSKIIGTTGLNEYESGTTNSYFAKVVKAIPKSSGASQIVSGMKKIIDEREKELNISGNLATVSTGTSISKIKDEIDSGRPIIISMHHNDYSNHAVVGYGYQTLGGTGTEEDEQFGYIVHYGWGDPNNWTNKTNVWINKTWCYNWVKMEVGHTHEYGGATGNYYERVCSCGHRISDYPFEITVSSGKATINAANFSAPNDFVIPSKINNYPVTSIAPNAFANQSNIINLKIPDSIECIGIGAFSGCTNLKNIILPFIGYSRNTSDNYSNFGYIFGISNFTGSTPTIQNGITYYIPSNLKTVTITNISSIKNRAFENCNNISKVTLPHGTTNIGNYAFLNCSSLNSMVIPQTVNTIGNNAFEGCTYISDVTIPYSVINIGTNAFPISIKIKWIYNPMVTASYLGIKENITSVEVNTGVTSINNNAFKNCINLGTVTIKENVTSVSSTAFNGCSSLYSVILYHNPKYTISQIGGNLLNLVTSVNIPYGVYRIKDNAFQNCTSLQSVEIPNHVIEGGENAFSGCTSLTSVTWYYNPNVSAADLKIQNVLTTVLFKNEVKGEKINSINSNAFVGCTKLTHITVPNYIVNIYNTDNSKITGVNLSFAPINTQITLEIPSEINKVKITSIGNSAFKGCSKLRSIIISDNVTNIDSNAFENCTSLISAHLSNSLTAMGSSTFKGCSSLIAITVPSKVTNIDSNTFENCASLTSVYLSRNLVAIGTSAFKGCSKLRSISIPSKVTNIDSNAFENCASLISVYLSNSLVAIGPSAFKGCTNLQTVTLSSNLTSIGNAVFKDCTCLSMINIPNSITNIDSNAFEGCTNLNNISLSTNLYAIGIKAFKDCTSLSSITLPSSVEYIDDEAFKNCSSLSNVTVNRAITGITNLGQSVFNGCHNELQIIVPINRIAEYKNKQYWSSYRNKIITSDEYSEIEIDCENSANNSISLNKAYNKLYKLNVNCSKSYKINTSSTSDVNIIIYNANMNVIDNSSNISNVFLSCGTYYVSFEFTDIEASGTIEIDITLRWPSTDIQLTSGLNNIKTNVHNTIENTCHGKFYYLNNKGAGFFKFYINAGNNIVYPEGAIKIYLNQNRTTILDRYSIPNEFTPTFSNINENELYVYLPESGYYYIDIILPTSNYSSITFTIEEAEVNNIDYSNSLTSICLDELFENKTSRSYFEEVTISHRSKIELDIITIGEITSNIPVYILEKQKDYGYGEGYNHYIIVSKLIENITSINRCPVFSIILDPGTYYIGYSDNISNVNINVAIRRKVNIDLNIDGTLITDPAYNQGFPLGSEVTLNNGAIRGTTLTEGFTRNIYIMVEDRINEPISRLEYDWYSSNESIAKVTDYGTVLALNVTEDTNVLIYAINKIDPSIVYRIGLTVLNETSDEEIVIESNMSYSYQEKNGMYTLELDFTNSPYPYIGYYMWGIECLDDISVDMEHFGLITSSGVGEVILTGNYTLNNRVFIIIYLTIND